MRSSRSRRWLVRTPGSTSPARKKRYINGRPLRSGWRPAALRYSAFAIAPALLIGGAALAFDGIGASNESVAPVVAADTPFTITGHGNGHGRGMGQWGAFGYAKDGWSAERILGHYYGGTTLGALPPTRVGVRLVARDDKPLDVIADAGLRVAGRDVVPGQAARMTPNPGGGAHAVITDGCGGPVVWEGDTDNPWIDPIDLAPDRPADQHVKLCDGGTPYRGSLGVALDGASFRTVNYLDIEDYLLSVVPMEMSAGWADQGGAEALRAQAIAARSYAAAEHRNPYAETCDNQDCQMYGGASKEDPRTTDAVRSTAGTVVMRDGAPVATEYSASTGGGTAGGNFPAVVDAGDRIAPDQNWTKTMSAGEIGKAFGVGELQSFSVTGNTPEGRVTGVHVVGSTGAVDATGEETRETLNLDSDWFQVAEGAGPPAPPAPPAPPTVLADAPVAPGVVAPPASPAPDPAPGDPIEDKYRELGGLNSTLGAPVGPVLPLPEEAGTFRTFTNGVIIYTPALGAQVVDASVLQSRLTGSGS